nr:MAG TPA: hypothetical protein [Caudoviricetes sp.]
MIWCHLVNTQSRVLSARFPTCRHGVCQTLMQVIITTQSIFSVKTETFNRSRAINLANT